MDADFGLWVEQLVAESTGKEGKGIVPVRDGGETPDIRLPDSYELGQEFFRWEFATAVAGSILGINPFDQPDVQAAKDKTSQVLEQGKATVDRDGSLDELLAEAGPGRYVAIQAFVDPAREGELEPLIRQARETGPPSPSGWGRGISTRRDSSTRAGRTPGFSSRSWTTSAMSCRSGSEVRLPGADRGAGRRRLRGAGGARAADREGDPVKLGMVGLGRMGGNLTPALAGTKVQTYARSGERTAASLAELVSQLEAPRVVWLMIPARSSDRGIGQGLLGLLDEGDVIVDGGNSNFRDSQRRAAWWPSAGSASSTPASPAGSGGSSGFALMVGGEAEPVAVVEPAFLALAPEGGYAHVGPSGAGHFVKMVHNGVEYGLMQAYAEGST